MIVSNRLDQILLDRVPMVVDSSHGKRLLTGKGAGSYSVLITSDGQVTPIAIEAKMMILEDQGMGRDRYYRMVTEEQYLCLGAHALYHDLRSLDEQMEERRIRRQQIEEQRVSRIYRDDEHN